MERTAQGIDELAGAFLLSKRVSGCTDATLGTYRLWLRRFQESVGPASTGHARAIAYTMIAPEPVPAVL